MASKVSSTLTLPWAWAIEALSGSNQVDTSLLIDIVRSAPEISDDVEKNVREMVTLRILEGLGVGENQIKINDTRAQGQKLELDPSKGPEDVLRQLLEEMSATDPKTVGPEVLNWDIQSFIVHKRTSFPMHALQKLKEAILEGSHSVLASLKERSGLAVRTQCGLAVRTQCDNNTSVNLGMSNCLSQSPGENCGETSQNKDGELEDDLRDINLIQRKSTVATSGENLRMQTCEDQIKLIDGSSEKLKKISNITGGTVVENSIVSPLNGRSIVVSEGIVQCIEREGFHLQNEVEVGSSTPQNRDYRVEENFEIINSLPAKTTSPTAAADNLERLNYDGKITLEDGYNSHAKAAEKIRQGAYFNGQNIAEHQKTSPLCGQSINASKETLECCEREVHKLQLEVEVGSSTPQNRDDELPGTVPDRNLLPSKRNRAVVSTENLGRQTSEDEIMSSDGFDSHAEAAKKFKQDPNVTGDSIVENPTSSPIHGIMKISSDIIIEDISTGTCNLEKEASLRATEYNESPHDSGCQNAALKRISQNCDADDRLPSPLEVEVSDNRLAEFSALLNNKKNGVDEGNGHSGVHELRTSNNTSSAGTCPENASYLFDVSFLKNASNGGEAKDDMVCSPEMEITGDSDECDDDRKDAALNKDALLSSHCTYSQDSFATQSNSCIKCNKDGQLLTCSSSTCQLVVHEGCLRSAGTFDENGKFYCPFCAYSRAICEFLQVKKKASLARKDLAMFIGVKTDCGPKKSILRPDGAKQSHSRINGEFGVDNEGNFCEQLMNKASKSQSVDNVENRHLAELPKSFSVDNPLYGEKMVSTNGTADVSAKTNLEKEGVGQQLLSPGGNPEQLRASELVKKSNKDSKNPNSIDRNEKKREMCGKKVQGLANSTLPLEALCGLTTESSEESSEKLATSRRSKRLQNASMQYAEPAVPRLRRKALPWSAVEEEKLMEGVQRLSSINDGAIPWSKILEFGADVFQKGRTAVDLKDKWRNMSRGSSVSK